ncbi:MAG: hypothetical protein SPJ69_08655, partial [Campylobacter sp.]|uniref:hypothetical protein n=3 Tax=Campylobacter sp. TaxID=205 RepID=UPI002972A5BE
KMNLKLIQQDNFSGEMIAINPDKIKKISLEYEIIKCDMTYFEMVDIRTKLGIEAYKSILDYYTDEENLTDQEKAQYIYILSSRVGKENLNYLLNALKENKSEPKIDAEIKSKIIELLGAEVLKNTMKRLKIDENSANIKTIDFLLKNDDITIKYHINMYRSLIENEGIKHKLKDEFKDAQRLFLEDYSKQLCSPNIAEVITPRWDILKEAVDEAVRKAK